MHILGKHVNGVHKGPTCLRFARAIRKDPVGAAGRRHQPEAPSAASALGLGLRTEPKFHLLTPEILQLVGEDEKT